jgi:hypothetical protein
LCLAAKFLAASLELKPQALSASFNLVGLPDLESNDPFIPPNLAAKETRLGLVPVFTGDFKLEPSVRLKNFLPASFKPPEGFWKSFCYHTIISSILKRI